MTERNYLIYRSHAEVQHSTEDLILIGQGSNTSKTPGGLDALLELLSDEII